LRRLHELFPQGEVLAETAVSTTDGVKVTDAAWLSPGRTQELDAGSLFSLNRQPANSQENA